MESKKLNEQAVLYIYYIHNRERDRHTLSDRQTETKIGATNCRTHVITAMQDSPIP